MKNIFVSLFSVMVIAACNNEKNPEIVDEQTFPVASHPMTVYKSPTCGCCNAWVDYLEEEGFNITTVDTDDMGSIKTRLGLPGAELASCHTATIGDYLIEGHVKVYSSVRTLEDAGYSHGGTDRKL